MSEMTLENKGEMVKGAASEIKPSLPLSLSPSLLSSAS